MTLEGGSKTIERVGAILRALESEPENGLTSGQIAAATGFDKATAYRALVSLVRIGLVDRDTDSRRFRLGVYLFNLGAIAARRFSVLAHAREVVAEIARETGDTVYLSVRNRHDSVCIECASGSYPIKAQTLTVGESVPLGVSAGGVAMLSTMSEAAVNNAIRYNAVEIAKLHSIRPDEIMAHVEQARTRGYAHYAGQVVAGMGAVARPIRGPQGQGIAVVSVTAVLDRLSDARVRLINDLLAGEIEKIEQRALLIGNRLETIA